MTKDPAQITNVRQWYRATRLAEFQINEIDKGLTFPWIGEHLNDIGKSELFDRLHGLDTLVRENILHEALVRKMLKVKKQGQYVFTHWLWLVAQARIFTSTGIDDALADANCTIGW